MRLWPIWYLSMCAPGIGSVQLPVPALATRQHAEDCIERSRGGPSRQVPRTTGGLHRIPRLPHDVGSLSRLNKTGAPCVTNRSKLRAIRIFQLSSDGLPISHGKRPRAIVRNVVGDHVVAFTARPLDSRKVHAKSGSAERCGCAVRPNYRQARARRPLLRALLRQCRRR